MDKPEILKVLETSLRFLNSLEGRVSYEVWCDMYEPLKATRDTIRQLKTQSEKEE